MQTRPCATTSPSADDERMLFRKLFAFAASQIDVSPVKRPLLEGTFSFPLTDDVTATVVSSVEGVCPDAVEADVRRRALALGAAIDACVGSAQPTNPLHFLRQRLLLANALTLEHAGELDLHIRFALDAETGAGAEERPSTAFVRCAVYVTDPWVALPVEQRVFAGEADSHTALGELLAEAGAALGEWIAPRRAAYLNDCLREAERRVVEATTGAPAVSSLALVREMAGAGPTPGVCDWRQRPTAALTALHAWPCPLECRVRVLSHRSTLQPLLLCCSVAGAHGNEWRLGASGMKDGTPDDALVEVVYPLVAVTAAGSGRVYAAYDRIPAVPAAALAAVHARGELVENAAQAPVSVLGAALDILAAAYPRLAFALAGSARDVLGGGVARIAHLTRLVGRPTVNAWSAAVARAGGWSGRPAPPLPPLLLCDVRACAPHTGSTLRMTLRCHLAYEVGWVRAPMVRVELPAPSELNQRAEEPLQLVFPSLLAVDAGSGCVFALGRRFDSCLAALLALRPEDAQALSARQTPPAAKTNTGGEASAGVPPRVGVGEAAVAPTPTQGADAAGTESLSVDVLDVEQVLVRLGVVRCAYDPHRKLLTAYDAKENTLLEFAHMDTFVGLARLLRFVGKGQRGGRVYRTVSLQPGCNPSTALRRLLRASLSGSTSTGTLKRPPPYMRKLQVPLPLCTMPAAIPYTGNVEQMDVTRRLLALVQHYTREPTRWPLPRMPMPCFFQVWPLTRGTLVGLNTRFPDFQYSFKVSSDTSAVSGRDDGVHAKVVEGSIELTFTSGAGHRAVFTLEAGPRMLQQFYQSLAAFTAEVAPAMTGDAPANGDETAAVGIEDDEEGEASSDAALLSPASPAIGVLPWESLCFYAVPPRIDAALQRSHAAAAVVVDNCLRSEAVVRRRNPTGPCELLLPITPSFTIRLAQRDAAAVSPARSPRAQLAEALLADGLTILAPATTATRELAELVHALSVDEAAVATPAARRDVFCQLKDGAPCTAEVHLGSSGSAAGAVIAAATGANRLEAVLALLPRLRRLASAQCALRLTPVVTREKVVRPAEMSSCEKPVSIAARAAAVARQHALARVWAEYSLTKRTLSLVGEDTAGARVGVASLPCPVDEVPRLLVYLYRSAAAADALPVSPSVPQGAGAFAANEHADIVTLQRMATRKGAAWVVTAIATSLNVQLTAPSLIQTRQLPSQPRPWVADAYVDLCSLGVTITDAMDGEVPVPSQPLLALRVAREGRRQAIEACLQALLLWIVHGIPVPVVGAATHPPNTPRRARPLFKHPFTLTLTPPSPDSTERPPPLPTALAPLPALVPEEAGGSLLAAPLSSREQPRPPRRAVRVTLREDLRPSTSPPTAATRFTLPPAKVERVDLSTALCTAVTGALTRTTGLRGVVYVRLSTLFGVQALFRAAAVGEGAVSRPALLLSEPWPQRGRAAAAATTVWPPLHILACLATAADRAGAPGAVAARIATVAADAAVAMGEVGEGRRAARHAGQDPEAVCVTFLSACCGWRVEGSSAAALATVTDAAAREDGPLPIRVELSVWSSACGQRPPGGGRPVSHPASAEVGVPFLGTFTARVRLVQLAESADGAATIAYACTLAQVEAATELAARRAAWGCCLDALADTLALDAAARAELTAAQLYRAVAQWLVDRL